LTATVVPCLGDGIIETTSAQHLVVVRVRRKRPPPMTSNALTLLKARYLQKDSRGHVIESPRAMFLRAARAIAHMDSLYDSDSDVDRISDEFYQLMTFRDFLPSSPTLMNAGLENHQLSACYVMPVEGSTDQIIEACRMALLVQQSGGGTGFSLSNLASGTYRVGRDSRGGPGPVLVMRLLDAATEVVKHDGNRRGANMGILDVSHPDIIDFITSKDEGHFLQNFTISVALSDRFMQAVDKDEDFELVDPASKIVVDRVRARDVFDLIARMAWKSGDPGVVFIDEINRHNPTPRLGPMEATNPCGEQPLLPYESCALGSINLAQMVGNGLVDWERLRTVVHSAVHFLDNSIDANAYPSKKIEEVTKSNRKIGLGIMGWADSLIQMGIPYDSEEAIAIARKVAKFIRDEAIAASIKLARKRGSFPNFVGSSWHSEGFECIRNATLTTIAPTGSISIIAGCSSGIEPLFAISFARRALNGEVLTEVNPLFVRVAKQRSFYSKHLMMTLASEGSLQRLDEVPEDVKKVFATAHDISPEWHVRMLAAFQTYCDNAVSKTVNIPRSSRVCDVKRIFILAHRLRCKGVTVYRHGSRESQVLMSCVELGRKEATE